MAGLLRLCFISSLLLFLFPDLNTNSTASPVPAPGPNVPHIGSPTPLPTPASQASAPGPNVPSIVSPPVPPPPPANQGSAGAPPPPVPVPEAKVSSGGLNGGQKAGIAIGVLAGAGALLLGGLVYMKRRSNIRRSQFGRAARTPIP
ncbi:classical arabinogalactan protein 5-like isoform X2 [Alnus glutinosa]|uniref:classical arabinogalactan protein 5-like isoform X2 n=1 Tax=Alnus glutinosa TaxID=3517 RepID=UPI002D77788C|nr:classical arabinogalactan protein 5-like isoform X2 [Alnus glutinosa]